MTDLSKLVKPLVWEEDEHQNYRADGACDGPEGIDRMCYADGSFAHWWVWGVGEFQDLAAAQSAANADHADRVLAALDGDALRELVEFLELVADGSPKDYTANSSTARDLLSKLGLTP